LPYFQKQMLQLTIVIVYLIAVIAIGILSRRKHWGLDDFFVSGRRCSTLFVTGSLLATIIGGSATIGMAGLGFSRSYQCLVDSGGSGVC
jgi:SSS family solute:Na+ symporter